MSHGSPRELPEEWTEWSWTESVVGWEEWHLLLRVPLFRVTITEKLQVADHKNRRRTLLPFMFGGGWRAGLPVFVNSRAGIGSSAAEMNNEHDAVYYDETARAWTVEIHDQTFGKPPTFAFVQDRWISQEQERPDGEGNYRFVATGGSGNSRAIPTSRAIVWSRVDEGAYELACDVQWDHEAGCVLAELGGLQEIDTILLREPTPVSQDKWCFLEGSTVLVSVGAVRGYWTYTGEWHSGHPVFVCAEYGLFDYKDEGRGGRRLRGIDEGGDDRLFREGELWWWNGGRIDPFAKVAWARHPRDNDPHLPPRGVVWSWRNGSRTPLKLHCADGFKEHLQTGVGIPSATKLAVPTPVDEQGWSVFRGVEVLVDQQHRAFVYLGEFRNGHPMFTLSEELAEGKDQRHAKSVWRDDEDWLFGALAAVGQGTLGRMDHITGGDPNLPPTGLGWWWAAFTEIFAPTLSFNIAPGFEEALLRGHTWSISVHKKCPVAARLWVKAFVLAASTARLSDGVEETLHVGTETPRTCERLRLPIEIILNILEMVCIGDMLTN